MGLDIYLYRCEDREAAKALESRYEAESKATWHFDGRKYDQLTGAEKDAANAKMKRIAAELGLDEYGSSKAAQKIEMPSTKHPEHYFKVGYLRSSYNESGINSYLDRLGLPDLNEIFSHDDDEYEFAPDWQSVKDKATDVLTALRALDTTFDVFDGGPSPFGSRELPASDKAVRELFLAEKERQQPEFFESYSNGKGDFFVNGINVLALIHGIREFLGRQVPCVYAVFEKKPEPDGGFYTQALEIVIENCDYVMAQPDPQHYYLHWSG